MRVIHVGRLRFDYVQVLVNEKLVMKSGYKYNNVYYAVVIRSLDVGVYVCVCAIIAFDMRTPQL